MGLINQTPTINNTNRRGAIHHAQCRGTIYRAQIQNIMESKTKCRKSIRLPYYDYSESGYYFITICTKDRKIFFDNERIEDIVKKFWLEIPKHFQNTKLDEWIIIPNHLHGIVIVENNRRGAIHHAQCRGAIHHAQCRGAIHHAHGFDKSNPYRIKNNPMLSSEPTLGKIIRWFKGRTSYEIHKNSFKYFGWQRNYYEHIIRNEKSLNNIRNYIIGNPDKWEEDVENPKNDFTEKQIRKFYDDLFNRRGTIYRALRK